MFYGTSSRTTAGGGRYLIGRPSTPLGPRPHCPWHRHIRRRDTSRQWTISPLAPPAQPPPGRPPCSLPCAIGNPQPCAGFWHKSATGPRGNVAGSVGRPLATPRRRFYGNHL